MNPLETQKMKKKGKSTHRFRRNGKHPSIEKKKKGREKSRRRRRRHLSD